MAAKTRSKLPWRALLLLAALCLLITPTKASVGDRLPEFHECKRLCERDNCDPNNNPTSIPLHHQLLLWTCPKECDYTCQHIITNKRVAAGQPVTQFYGKWPFIRFLGAQEPCSVIFSLGNLIAHRNGLNKIYQQIPATYTLRPFYITFAYIGIATWVFSAIFHTRDFIVTEQLDYFTAGLSVLYGMYYAFVHVFRLDKPTPRRQSFLRLWTVFCASLFIAHVSYLKLWRWDYGYNMMANVIVGVIQNLLWTYYSFVQYRKTHDFWAAWPSLIVTWISLAMSLELLDFPPIAGALDAHSLWHLGTIIPVYMWYGFFVKDSADTIAKTQGYKDKDIKA